MVAIIIEISIIFLIFIYIVNLIISIIIFFSMMKFPGSGTRIRVARFVARIYVIVVVVPIIIKKMKALIIIAALFLIGSHFLSIKIDILFLPFINKKSKIK